MSGSIGVAPARLRRRRPPRRQQPTTAARDSHPGRRHRTDHRPLTETRRDRGPRRTDRGQHVPAPRPGRLRYRHVHPRGDRDRHEPVPHHLRAPGDHPQPPADRRPPEPPTAPRSADARHRPPWPPPPPRSAPRHRPCAATTSPATTHASPHTLRHRDRRGRTGSADPDDTAGPSETPPNQHPIRARRARHLATCQPGLDALGIDLYRDHQCLSHYARCPRDLCQEIQRGRRAPISSSTH